MTPAEREAQLPPLDENDEDRRVADGLRNMEFLNVYQVRAAYRDLTASYCCRERQLLAKISLISSLELTLSNATGAGLKQLERIAALEYHLKQLGFALLAAPTEPTPALEVENAQLIAIGKQEGLEKC